MAEELEPGIQSTRAAVLGWLLTISFCVLLWNIVEMPRTPLDQRATLYAFHFSVGLLVSGLAVLRLTWWFTGPKLQAPAGLPESSFAFHRAILLALLLVFTAETLIGFVYAWGIGEEVSLFGIHLPAGLPKSESTRMAYGYFHSALAFYYMILIPIWLAFGLYQHLRYRVGLRRLFPGPAV